MFLCHLIDFLSGISGELFEHFESAVDSLIKYARLTAMTDLCRRHSTRTAARWEPLCLHRGKARISAMAAATIPNLLNKAVTSRVVVARHTMAEKLSISRQKARKIWCGWREDDASCTIFQKKNPCLQVCYVLCYVRRHRPTMCLQRSAAPLANIIRRNRWETRRTGMIRNAHII